jgi:DNA-binding beta-propeller fold protein YncE
MSGRGVRAILALVLVPGVLQAQVHPGDIVLGVHPDRIDHFRPDGTRVATTAGKGSGAPQFGAAVLSYGFVATRRTPASIVLFDFNGFEIATFAAAELFNPLDVSVFSNGAFVVSDYLQEFAGELEWYSTTGEHLRTVALPQGISPFGNHVDSNDEVWVTDLHGWILHYDATGSLLHHVQVGFQPADVVHDPSDGTLWASNYLTPLIFHVTPAGQILSSFETGFGFYVTAIGLAPDGTLYAASETSDAVKHFDKSGTLLDEFPIDRFGQPIFMTVVGPGTYLVPSKAYCTPKTNSLGCVPGIHATGFPSSLASSGFAVTATNVRNQKEGVLL